MWVATEYGLNRTDGTGFTIYHHDPDDPGSVKSNYVRTVYEDRHHSLRVGCINGLMEFDRANDSFVEIPMFNRGERVYPHVAAMIELSNGELWIATLGNGIFRLDHDGRRAMRLDDVTSMVGSDYVTCMHEDSSHILWIGTENSGLCRYFPASGTARIYRADELPGIKISSITEDSHGNIYAGILDHGGVVAYNRAADTFAPACDRATGYPVQDVAIDSDGSSILMAVDGSGLKIIRNNTIADYPLDTPNIDIANSKVHHILIDRDDNLWLGIFQRGVYLSPCSRFKFSYMGQHQTVNPIGKGCVMMVKVDSRSDVWVSCDNDGLYRVYSVTGQCMAHIPMTATVLSMAEDSRGRLWAGTYGGGLALIDPATSRVSFIPSLAGTRIYGLAIDSDGNLLAATLGDGVFSYNPATGATRRFRAVSGGGAAGPDV
ncbi:MAG: hybrid sensor histidine kinase/response regulator, partial [Duncaniella sp.]|nr:hybrid sensor histidine kinase/response regulator [Duncaniella sp.]